MTKDEARERYRPTRRAHYLKNREELLAVSLAYRKANPEKCKAARMAWFAAHPAYGRSYKARRRALDLNYRLTDYLRNRVLIAIRKGQKSGSAIGDLGCSVEELRSYLEGRFKPGMTWENWGRYGWHIDHVKPLASFDLSNRQEFLRACHYTNLQPLWAVDNLKKSDRVVGDV